jgi:uncharacterized membrane protein YedE/YeeE
MNLLIVVFGFFFGALLWYAKLNRYNTISGMATLEDLAVAKAIAVAIGVGVVLINAEIGLGLATYHAKPVILSGLIVGGLLFGAGMAILGYCPGTLAVSMGEGALDAVIGFIGGIAGGLIYTVAYPSIRPLLGADLGKITLRTAMDGNDAWFYLTTIIIAACMISIAFWLHKKEKDADLKWLYAGIGLAVLNALVFLTPLTDRVIGASSFYPYAAGSTAGLKDTEYFGMIEAPGHWEFLFLSGAFLSGLVLSVTTRQFKWTMVHSRWAKYKGTSVSKRVVWSFLGGVMLLLGARMAGGCTSGHVISGGMQLALSSYVFMVFVFTGLLITGRLFYSKA